MAINLTGKESVYQCDTCNRHIRVPLNPYGLDVIDRCIITNNCLGRLHISKTTAERNLVPTTTPPVDGLEDWVQRTMLYNHEQTIQRLTWRVQHNLGTYPIIQVVVNRPGPNGTVIHVELPPDSYTVTPIDYYSCDITFTRNESGVAQCISTMSANRIIQPVPQATQQSTFAITNSNILTIATENNDPQINSLSIRYSGTTTATINYLGIETPAITPSPWNGINTVHILGKSYTVRSFDIINRSTTPDAFSNGTVLSGSNVEFLGLSGQNFILLTNPPYTAFDRIFDRLININALSPANIIFAGAEMAAQDSAIRNVFPYIVVVD